MTDISPAVIKDLREKTGAGMMDCKKALAETKGNFEEAIDWLRKKGMAASAKKGGPYGCGRPDRHFQPRHQSRYHRTERRNRLRFP